MVFASRLNRIALLAGPLLASAFIFSAHAQDVLPEAEVIEVDAPIDSVTLYLGRAAVTRRAQIDLQTGLYEFHFDNLPAAVQPDSLQARATGEVKVVSVDFDARQVDAAPSKKIAELDATIQKLQQTLKELEQERALLNQQAELINSLGFRITSDATEKSGSKDLQIDAVKQQLDFVAAERTRLLEEQRKLDERQRTTEDQLRIAQAERNALGGSSKTAYRATVSAAATTSGPVTIELVYLVSNATWNPSYNIRAAGDLSGAAVEYDAMLTQRTGEDWDNIKLTLSTAQPRLAANPPSIDPWYVDIYRPEVARSGGVSMRAANVAPPAAEAAYDRGLEDKSLERAKAIEEWSRDAAVTGSGPAVAFEIPRRVSIPANAEKQQRTRIGSFAAAADFIYVAVPLQTNAVYLRGDLQNSSAYQLLPGPVAIFLGQDYVGPTSMNAVAPNGKFKVHFGVDPAISAKRTLVQKETSRTGLLSGGRKTSYDYRLSIDNGSGRPIKVEMWDRAPVSRNDQIQIEVVDLSVPLATDKEFTEEDQPRGLLKWILNVPAGATGNKALLVTYGVEINRGKDIEMTPLPE